jgi:hypothetical protein
VDFTGAGAVVSGLPSVNAFQRFKAEKEDRGEEVWAPYKSREEWQLARWLMLSGITKSNIDSFAKLPIVSHACHNYDQYLTMLRSERM